jgi:recombinational DNA repair protein (RecF pathway)
MARSCEMVVGFLVPHRCEQPALGRCVRCNRGFCEAHLSVKQEGLVCHACEQGLPEPVVMAGAASAFDANDAAAFAGSSESDASETFADLS